MNPLVLASSFFGTVAFSILYSIPPKYYFACGCNGLLGWIVYQLAIPYFGDTVAIFLTTIALYLYARIMAVRLKCPEIVFLLAGIFPIVPGAGIYWTAYYLVAGNMDAASVAGSGALRACMAMVFGIAIVYELPGWLFTGKRPKKIDKKV